MDEDRDDVPHERDLTNRPTCTKCGEWKTYSEHGKATLIRDRKDRDGVMRKMCVTCGLVEEVAAIARRKELVKERMKREGLIPSGDDFTPDEMDTLRLHAWGVKW